MIRSNRLAAIILVVAGLGVLLLSVRLEDAKRHSSSTSFSQQGQGASVLLEFLRRVKPYGAIVNRRAVLDEHEFGRDDVFLTLSPKSPFSRREARILRRFVEKGGHLVIGTESPHTSANVSELMTAFSLTDSREAFPDFENQKTASRTAPVARGPIPAGVALEFYSGYGFPSERGFDFVKEERIGEGTVTLMAGIPIFANSMIGRGENWRAAHALANAKGRIVIDEYHHLFSEKSVASLLSEPFFALPVFGSVLVAILFLSLGRLGRKDVWGESPPVPSSRSFHDFGTSVFTGLARRSRSPDLGVQEHSQFLRGLFPDASGRIEEVASQKGSWLSRGTGLLQLHKSLLRERGWKV